MIKTVNVNVISVGGAGSFVTLSIGATCSASFVTDIDFTTKGIVNLPLDPGIAIPSGQRLWANAFSGNVQVSAIGYKVPAGSVPAGAPAKTGGLAR